MSAVAEKHNPFCPVHAGVYEILLAAIVLNDFALLHVAPASLQRSILTVDDPNCSVLHRTGEIRH